MICYNVTVKIISQIEEQWVKWMKEEHIPDVIGTGLFIEYKFFKLLEQDERDGITYVVQYFSPSNDLYKKYIEEFAPVLREKAFSKWQDRFIAFRTVMETVH
jgi:hypothetical protein